eukprot:gene11717-24571_t
MLSNQLKRLLTLTSAFLSRSVVYSFPTSGRLIARNYTPTSLKMADLTSNEVKAAAIAKSSDPAINPALPTFFDKLVSKEVPSKIIYEDDLCMAFHDINPQGPVHFLVIPKIKDGLNRLSNAREDQTMLLGHLLYTAQKVANAEGLKEGGFRVVINDGSNGAQSVYHLHLHVIGGRQMGWPPG